MSDKQLTQPEHTSFESIRVINEQGGEIWLARQLAKVLDYAEFRNFLPVIEKAKKPVKTVAKLWPTISWRSTRWSKLTQVPSANGLVCLVPLCLLPHCAKR